MFMLYAVVIGLGAGFLLRGRTDGLTTVQFRWGGLALAALLVQVALFSGPIAGAIGDAGATIYVASSAVVLGVVLANRRIPGLAIVAVGAASNLAAILANGGWMPASSSALTAVGASIGPDYSNSREVATPALAMLTDTFAMPSWLPMANIFSVGDLLIGVGIATAIVVLMRRARTQPRPAPPPPAVVQT